MFSFYIPVTTYDVKGVGDELGFYYNDANRPHGTRFWTDTIPIWVRIKYETEILKTSTIADSLGGTIVSFQDSIRKQLQNNAEEAEFVFEKKFSLESVFVYSTQLLDANNKMIRVYNNVEEDKIENEDKIETLITLFVRYNDEEK